MTPRTRPRKRVTDLDALLALIKEWPQSWAGSDEDEAVGRDLVQLLRPFIVHLHETGLSSKTVRRHLNNAWVIGGEIIRRIGYEPKLRRKPVLGLLLDAIAAGDAPLVEQLSEAEQAALDATARKLLRFLSACEPGPTSPAKP